MHVAVAGACVTDEGYYEEQFERAVEYLSRVRRRKSVWKKATSYGWKQQAERYLAGLEF